MIQIYNTLTRKKEPFNPIKEGVASLYQCGPTVYWTQQIGNMRAVFVGDIIFRTLKYNGLDVNFVRNYTDVGHLTGDNLGDPDQGEDKMDKASKRDGKTPEQIAEKFTAQYDADVLKINALTPTHRPKATDNISEMKKMIKTLIKGGFAYETDFGIYFDISKATNYTRLSGQKIEENLKNLGAGDVEDKQKKNSADFALWIYKKGTHIDALQTWKSPTATLFKKRPYGFPGWHIECSAMSKKFLGDTLDIHIGGIEHIPIHHTNEITQSENANGKPYVNFWIHHEHLLIENAKMSKSEGTAFSIDDLISKGFDPLALRFLFLQAHYRSKQNFTWETLEAAQNGLNKLKNDIAKLPKRDTEPDDRFQKLFKAKINDDFNTPQALSVVYDVLDSSITDEVKRATILEFDKILGLRLDEKVLALKIPAEITELAKERDSARKSGDFDKADKLRKKIEEKGFGVNDKDRGFEVYKK